MKKVKEIKFEAEIYTYQSSFFYIHIPEDYAGKPLEWQQGDKVEVILKWREGFRNPPNKGQQGGKDDADKD